ncbi:hypothetical protein SRHO_G00050280 [Serrasalmus rhombeus]
MTLAQYEQAKRESLQKKENRRLALETRMRDWSNNRVETTPRKEEKKQELEAKRQEENKKEAEKKAEEKEAEKKAEEKEVEKKAEEKKEKKKWMKPMTNSIELNTSSSSNSADIYISSWNNTPKRKRSGSHTVWSLAKDPEKF